jgi:GR25 family glycosyltransferase involved in LPS biosynthesis
MKDYFDRVVVISLQRRSDRMRRLLGKLSNYGWPFIEPQPFRAVDGSIVPHPREWRSGGGAFGCQQSHLRVIQDALMDDVNRLIVLEDDAEIRESFSSDAQEFLNAVPSDWECLMLGGQHMAPPSEVSPGVVLCKNTQRTHCYAVNRDGMKTLAKLWSESVNHIDWDMGPCLGQRGKTYAPSPFLVGQACSRSDINGRRNPTQFWNAPRESIPVLWLQTSREVAEQMREYGCHYGADLDRDGNDTGLNIAFPSRGKYVGGIKKFLGHVTWECESFSDKPGIATIWHPNATEECAEALLADCSPTVIKADTFAEASEAAAAMYPELFFLRPTASRPPVILLKTSPEVVKALRESRLVHTGNWRDANTDIDHGLSDIMDRGERCLREWHSVLDREAEWANSVVGIWHPQVTTELAATTGRRVVVIDATDFDEARRQVEAALL